MQLVFLPSTIVSKGELLIHLFCNRPMAFDRFLFAHPLEDRERDVQHAEERPASVGYFRRTDMLLAFLLAVQRRIRGVDIRNQTAAAPSHAPHELVEQRLVHRHRRLPVGARCSRRHNVDGLARVSIPEAAGCKAGS